MIPKPKRKVDRKLLDSFHTKDCIVNNHECSGQVVAHHKQTKGAGGGDVIDNLLALCVFHHQAIHKIGTYTFYIKYAIKTPN